MLWIFYSLLSALGQSTSDAFLKKISGKYDSYFLVWSRFLFSAPFLLSILFFIPIPKLAENFLVLLIITCIIQIVAETLFVKSITSSPLSLVAPFLTLTPAFLVVTSFVMLGELPSMVGLFGILLIVFGAYLLNIHTIKDGLLKPFKAIFKEKGCIYMIITAFLYSILANLGKILIYKSSALFFTAVYFPLMGLLFIPLLLMKSKTKFKEVNKNKFSFFIIGFAFAVMILFHSLAVILVIVPYMISIKRTSSLFSVFYGYFMFKEENIKYVLLGAVVMVLGAVLITLF